MQNQQQVQTTKTKRITKKYPTVHDKPGFNEVYIKGNRPIVVYRKHCDKVIKKHNTLIIHAMTAAIYKAVKLAIQLRQQHPYLFYEMYTDSVPTLVQYEDRNKEIKQRSTVHIVLKKNMQNGDKIKYQ